MTQIKAVQVSFLMDVDEAWALAQLCKRFTWEDAVRLANHHDGGAERYYMLSAICRVGRSLEAYGITPR